MQKKHDEAVAKRNQYQHEAQRLENRTRYYTEGERKNRNHNGVFRTKDISILDGLKVWDTSYLWVEGKYLNAIVDRIPVDDLGELGKEYIKSGLAKPGDIANVVIGVEYNK